MMCEIVAPTHLRKEWKWKWKGGGGSRIFTSDTDIFNLTKTKHNGKLKTRIVSEVSTSNKSNFYISKR